MDKNDRIYNSTEHAVHALTIESESVEENLYSFIVWPFMHCRCLIDFFFFFFSCAED